MPNEFKDAFTPPAEHSIKVRQLHSNLHSRAKEGRLALQDRLENIRFLLESKARSKLSQNILKITLNLESLSL